MTLLEATLSSARTVRDPKFLEPPCPSFRHRAKLRFCLVIICHAKKQKATKEKYKNRMYVKGVKKKKSIF